MSWLLFYVSNCSQPSSHKSYNGFNRGLQIQFCEVISLQIIYSSKWTDLKGGQIGTELLKETFKGAIDIQRTLSSRGKKIAYFFIDPLLNSFEAANQFYFEVIECEFIEKINTYRSGAGPIQALADAKELIDHGLYDAVFIFGYEPLLTNRLLYGKEAITKGMRIFDEYSILQCYNEIGHRLCKELGLSKETFINLCDQLFLNYYKCVKDGNPSMNRGKSLMEHGADLFKLTDCANPNIDFSGGIIVANETTATFLQVPSEEKIKVSAVKYSMIHGSPKTIEKIVGNKENVFPHLKNVFLQVEWDTNIKIADELKKGNLYLEVYTCYPPVPMAFLLSTSLIETIYELPRFLEHYELTITGGMNFARAPWNNPALHGLIEMHQKLMNNSVAYGLLHGNGGIGEIQGIAILEKQ